MQDRSAATVSQFIYDVDNDLHVRAIDRLAHDLGISAEEVNSVYREILEQMRKDIKVKAFLPVLVSRAAKDRLLQQR